MEKKQKRRKEKGITLVALIVTIIVLLILVGVTIATLTRNNGIFTKAQEAKNKTEGAALEEKIKLLATENIINKYTGESGEKTAQELQKELNDQGENVLVIQWDKYIIFDLDENKEYRVMSDGSTEYWGESTIGQTLFNTKTANEDQVNQDNSTSNIIGIDNEGNTVNMLLWEYSLIEDESLGKIGTYGLNDAEALTGQANNRSAGYLGQYTSDGKIIETVPAYISTDNGNKYIAVTSMAHTFYNLNSLAIAPEIPDTVINMQVTFYKCENLKEPPSYIPDSVINLSYTFQDCSNLKYAPNIGKNVIYLTSTFRNSGITQFNNELPRTLITMEAAFSNCKELVSCNIEIPEGVKNLRKTFYNCGALIDGPVEIPSSVNDMINTFYGCSNLQGIMKINAIFSEDFIMEGIHKGYDSVFYGACQLGNGLLLKGSSNKLFELSQNNPKITFQ